MDFHPQTGELWASENGPQGGDEVNIIDGANYGWPGVSYSGQYRGDWVSDGQWQSDVVQPEILWWPSIAPAGLAFYTGDKSNHGRAICLWGRCCKVAFRGQGMSSGLCLIPGARKYEEKAC